MKILIILLTFFFSTPLMANDCNQIRQVAEYAKKSALENLAVSITLGEFLYEMDREAIEEEITEVVFKDKPLAIPLGLIVVNEVISAITGKDKINIANSRLSDVFDIEYKGNSIIIEAMFSLRTKEVVIKKDIEQNIQKSLDAYKMADTIECKDTP